jgi:hypothetical protein
LLYFPKDHPFLLNLQARHKTMVPSPAGNSSSHLSVLSLRAPSAADKPGCHGSPASVSSAVWSYVDNVTGQCLLSAENTAAVGGVTARCTWRLPDERSTWCASRIRVHLNGKKSKKSHCAHGLSASQIEARETVPQKVAQCSVVDLLRRPQLGPPTVKKYSASDSKQIQFNTWLSRLVVNNGLPLSIVEFDEFEVLPTHACHLLVDVHLHAHGFLNIVRGCM